MITEFLGAHCPDVLARVHGPAGAVELRLVEQTVGRPLPDDLADWWRLADGMDGVLIPMLFRPLSATGALGGYRTMIAAGSEAPGYGGPSYREHLAAPAGTVCRHGFWLPQWLPIATDLGTHLLFVDLRPGPDFGCVSGIDEHREHDNRLWPDVAAMLAEVAAAMRDGTPVRGYLLEAGADGIRWGW
ncbi:hypothetical protein GCM10010168_92580 [Actinoplanes ianthinogenes]|uniref:Knr4/Smi1-like domain-containing protein n=1 Tax=Actinoplanes ianthinogenes TaxID=122358 RepID=A0ABM7LK77_9ACTN|nr:hypothetical protein Aiant_02200 [Actinoplanes ianthinogenes]GGR59098.1 hypothetical protein GCM10010168_92580 [Actinoplanes ianthinogenes]